MKSGTMLIQREAPGMVEWTYADMSGRAHVGRAHTMTEAVRDAEILAGETETTNPVDCDQIDDATGESRR
jgi:hypothetical protein